MSSRCHIWVQEHRFLASGSRKICVEIFIPDQDPLKARFPLFTHGGFLATPARVLSVLSATWMRSPSSSQKPLIFLIQLHLWMYAARAWVVLSQCSRRSPVHCCPSHFGCTEYATQSNVVSRDQLVRLVPRIESIGCELHCLGQLMSLCVHFCAQQSLGYLQRRCLHWTRNPDLPLALVIGTDAATCHGAHE